MNKGDQVYVYRELLNLKGVYEHHGISCGDGSVIHYRKPSETIEKTSLEVFALFYPIYIKKYPQGFCFIDDLVVQRAHTRLGEQKYNLLSNNCEHFATWCKTGISESRQVRDFLPIITQLDPKNLYSPLEKSLEDFSPQTTKQLLEEALGYTKIVWDEVQPKYKSLCKEIDAWQGVAQVAIQQNRDDLALAALKRKLEYQQQAEDLKRQLEQVASITQDVVKKLQSHFL